MKIRVAKEILWNSLVNGEGVRAVIFFSGCKRNCKGCQNKELQDFKAGIEREVSDVVNEILGDLEMIDGVTISGGDPVYQMEGLTELCRELKKHNINIWLYTGELVQNLYNKNTELCKDLVDVIVDGPYIEELRNPDLKYRGSSNQKIWSFQQKEMKQYD